MVAMLNVMTLLLIAMPCVLLWGAMSLSRGWGAVAGLCLLLYVVGAVGLTVGYLEDKIRRGD